MSQYSRNHPDEPVSHDWFKGGKRSQGNIAKMLSKVAKREKQHQTANYFTQNQPQCIDDSHNAL